MTISASTSALVAPPSAQSRDSEQPESPDADPAILIPPLSETPSGADLREPEYAEIARAILRGWAEPLAAPTCERGLADFGGCLGMAVRAARESHPGEKLTQSGYAEVVGTLIPKESKKGKTGQDSISHIEQGEQLPSIRRLGALAAAACLPPSVLVLAAETALWGTRTQTREALSRAVVVELRKKVHAQRGSETVRAWKRRAGTVAAFPTGIGAAIRWLRRAARLSQQDLVTCLRKQWAHVTGFEKISAASQSQLETGTCSASWARLAGIRATLAREGVGPVLISTIVHYGECDAAARQQSLPNQLQALKRRATELLKSSPADANPDQSRLLREVLELLEQLGHPRDATPAAGPEPAPPARVLMHGRSSDADRDSTGNDDDRDDRSPHGPGPGSEPGVGAGPSLDR